MQRDTWIERVLLRCGLVESEDAERWMKAVVDALSGLVSEERAAELAAGFAFPASPARSETTAPVDAPRLIDDLAAIMGWPHGRVADRLPAALSVVREVTGERLWSTLAPSLPPGVTAVTPEREAHVGPPPRGARDLAAGRPGSRTPLGSTAPPAGQSDSIAASSDPRGHRKLSGAQQ